MEGSNLMELSGSRDHRDFQGLMEFCISCLSKKAYPAQVATETAFTLVEGDARGIYTHGAAGGTGLEESLSFKGATATVDVNGQPQKLDQKYSTIGVMDGDAAPGHYTSRLAVEWVRQLARAHGMAKVYVYNTNHFGAAGIWSDEIAKDKDLIGHVTCTAHASVRFLGDDPEGVDYTKGAAIGKQQRLGSNPDAYSIPYENGLLTIDMANTELAISLFYKAFKEGLVTGKPKALKIPNYVADAEYRPTFDPGDVVRLEGGELKVLGSVFPHGGLRGYKGQIMIQRVEADHSFGGGPIRVMQHGSISQEARVSHAFEAQATDFLYTKTEALERMNSLVGDWSDYMGPASRMPGERSQLAREYSLSNGIPYSEDQIATLRRCGEMAGVDLDTVGSSVKSYPANLFTK